MQNSKPMFNWNCETKGCGAKGREEKADKKYVESLANAHADNTEKTQGVRHVTKVTPSETKQDVIAHDGNATEVEVDYISANGEMDDVKGGIEEGMNVLLTGPTGCGKTKLVSTVGKILGQKIYTIQGADGASPEYIIGYRELQSKDGVSVTKWVDGALPRAMREGAILYVDEPNALPDGIRFYLFAAMDHRREISLAENECEIVKASPGFTVVGAMNEGQGYSGTSALNLAFRDRFDIIVDLDYLTSEKEIELVGKTSGIDKDIASKIVDVGTKLRVQFQNGNLKTPTSSRALIAWARLVKNGKDVKQAAKLTLVNKVPSTKANERKAIQDAIDLVIKDPAKEKPTKPGEKTDGSFTDYVKRYSAPSK